MGTCSDPTVDTPSRPIELIRIERAGKRGLREQWSKRAKRTFDPRLHELSVASSRGVAGAGKHAGGIYKLLVVGCLEHVWVDDGPASRPPVNHNSLFDPSRS